MNQVLLTHIIWTVVIFGGGLAVHKKVKKTGLKMLKDFRNFFFTWSLLFFGLMSSGWALGLYLDNQTILSLGYTIPHVFSYVAIGFLWKVQAGIQFPRYEKLFWVFVAYGVGLSTFGVIEMPQVIAENNILIFGPESLFPFLQQIGSAVGLSFVASMSFFTAYSNSGANRLKMILLAIGSLMIVVAGVGYGLGSSTGNLIGTFGNVTFILSFLSAIYLSKVTNALGVINDKLR